MSNSWELASDLKNSMPQFESAGAKLIAIGVGTSDKARILADGVRLCSVRGSWLVLAPCSVPIEGTSGRLFSDVGLS